MKNVKFIQDKEADKYSKSLNKYHAMTDYEKLLCLSFICPEKLIDSYKKADGLTKKMNTETSVLLKKKKFFKDGTDLKKIEVELQNCFKRFYIQDQDYAQKFLYFFETKGVVPKENEISARGYRVQSSNVATGIQVTIYHYITPHEMGELFKKIRFYKKAHTQRAKNSENRQLLNKLTLYKKYKKSGLPLNQNNYKENPLSYNKDKQSLWDAKNEIENIANVLKNL